MHPQSIKARSTPYPTRSSKYRVCGYCGITQNAYSTMADYYCPTCMPHAIKLGWTTPGNTTYTCTRCGKTRRGNNRDLCGPCTWNTGKGKNR